MGWKVVKNPCKHELTLSTSLDVDQPQVEVKMN
jgi:hypothetical protein